MISIRNRIGSNWVNAASGETGQTRNPADPAELLAEYPRASRAEVRAAIAAAREALPGWSTMPPPARGAILDKASQLLTARADEIAQALTREEGKTLAEAKGEVLRARDIFRYFAGEGWRLGGSVLPSNVEGELLYTRREPLGVIAVITPWNFPIAIPAWKIAPALVYGNTVVFKPAEYTPHTAFLLVEALVDAGLPPGVINFVTGPGANIGDELVSSPEVNGVTFTGSHAVGTTIYAKASRNLARVQLEMGGKNPLVVLDDAPLDMAVKIALTGGFGLTGQACTATSRLIVQAGIAPSFTEALAQAARVLKVGDGLDAQTQMGPVVSQSQLDTDLEYIQIGQQEGATLLIGGKVIRPTSRFLEPTIFTGVESTMRIAREEIFGPVISIIQVANLDEAIEAANTASFGLAAGVVTNDLKKALAFANRVEAGVVKVNEPTTGLALQAPFGGFKQSSANTFKEQGQAAIEFYTRTKTIYLGHG